MTAEIVWITGASTGIGRAIALQYAAKGVRVFASARSEQKLSELVQAASNNRITALPCDVTKIESLRQAAQTLLEKAGYLDRVIINAGTCEYFSVAKPDWDMMARVMKVNFFGAVNTVEVALPLLRNNPNNNGHIAVTASLASVVPFSRAQAYGASKAALHYFFDSLRVDLAREKIAVTVIQPGFVETPMTAQNDFPMPFKLHSEKAAAIIIKKLNAKPRLIRFPKRLAWLLSTLRHLPGLWHWLATKPLQSSTAD